MLTFYYQALAIKSQRNTLHQSSVSHHKSHTSHRKQKSQPRQQIGGQLNTSPEEQASQPVLPAPSHEPAPSEPKPRIFKNLAIKQKLRELEMWRAEERIRKKLAQERVDTKDYEASVQQYLAKKIKQNIENSEMLKTSQRQQRSTLRRYRTLNEEEPKGQDFLSTMILSQRDQVAAEKPRAKRSNLIGKEESLLTHILRKQREIQEKSLRIVNTRKKVRHSQEGMESNGGLSRNGLLGDCRTNLLTHPYKIDYVMAMRGSKSKQSTQSLLQPWDAPC